MGRIHRRQALKPFLKENHKENNHLLSREWIAGLAQSRTGLLQVLRALSTTTKNSQQAVLYFEQNVAMVSLSDFQQFVVENPQGSTVTAGSVSDAMAFQNSPLIDVRFEVY